MIGSVSVPFSTLKDRSGTILTAAATQLLLDQNPLRRGWRLMNNGDLDLWFNDTGGAASAGGAGCFKIEAGDYYESVAGSLPGFQVSLFGVTAGHKFSASEW